MFHEQERTSVNSTNPMDFNWGGVEYTQQAIDEGKYEGDQVKIQVCIIMYITK